MICWDEDFLNFKEFGADNPENIDWDAVFPSSAYIVDVGLDAVESIISESSVLQDETNDIDEDTMDQLEEHLATGGACSPPWGVIDPSGKLTVIEGKHRLKKALLMKERSIPIVVNKEAKDRLVSIGIVSSFRVMTDN